MSRRRNIRDVLGCYHISFASTFAVAMMELCTRLHTNCSQGRKAEENTTAGISDPHESYNEDT